MKADIPTNNYKAFFAVFVLAFIFWFMVKMNQDYEYSLDIPLKVTINNEDVWLKYPAPEEVRVAFHGRGIDLLQLNFYEPAYEIDLSDEKGSYRMNLSQRPEYVNMPSEVTAEVRKIVRPHAITFELDKRLEKKLPVAVSAEVETEPGFIWVKTVSNPDSITLIGPASYVDTLDRVFTIKKDHQEINLSFDDNIQIHKFTNFNGEYLPEEIEVHYDIQRLAEKEIENVPVTVDNVPENYEVVPLPSVVTVYAKGGEKILSEASVKDFKVYIDFKTDWKQGESAKVKARLATDLNISHVESRPPAFDLIVQKKRR